TRPVAADGVRVFSVDGVVRCIIWVLQDNQTPPDSNCDGFRAARGVQLVKDRCDMELDGVLRNLESPSDFLVPQARRQQIQYFAFTWRQLLQDWIARRTGWGARWCHQVFPYIRVENEQSRRCPFDGGLNLPRARPGGQNPAKRGVCCPDGRQGHAEFWFRHQYDLRDGFRDPVRQS